MARQITGETAHEWLGAGMFALWVAHHALNASWHRRLFRGAVHALPGVPAGGQPASASGHGGDHGERGGPVPDGVCLPADFRGPVLGPAAAHPGLVLGAGFDGPPSGTPLGGPSWARFGGRPLCRRAPAARWVWRLLGLAVAGYGGYAFWYHQLPSVPVRPGPLCLFSTRPSRRWGSSWTIWPSWGCSSGWPTTAERGRRPWPGGRGRRSRIPWRKTAEPLGSAVMPVSDLFACR